MFFANPVAALRTCAPRWRRARLPWSSGAEHEDNTWLYRAELVVDSLLEGARGN